MSRTSRSAPVGARRPPWRGVGLLLAVLVAATGCGLVVDGPRRPESAAPGGTESHQAARPAHVRPVNDWLAADAEASVRLHRVDDTHMVAVLSLTDFGERGERGPRWGILADGFGESGGSTHDYPLGNASGIAWLDPSGRVLHKPYHLPDRDCLCSRRGDVSLSAEPGQTVRVYAVLAAPPADVDAVTVVTSVAPPFVDVPVERGAPEGLDYRVPEEHPDAEPEAADLVAVVDAPDETVVADTAETEIHLSADVLFDTDEAVLSERAADTLERTAARVEDSGATRVLIEGHTDDTGTDAINDPLSRERAEAVRDTLADLLGADVELTAVGHGSARPVADNDTERGRQRNRRVTVTVEHTAAPSPGPARPAPSPTAGEGAPATGFAVSGPARRDDGAEVEAALTGLRTLTPETALLSYTVTNPADSEVSVDLAYFSDEWLAYRYRATQGVSLVRPDTGRTFLPLRVSPLDDGERPWCLCTSASGIDMAATRLAPRQTREYYAVLPLAPGSTVVDVHIGLLPPMEGVAVDS